MASPYKLQESSGRSLQDAARIGVLNQPSESAVHSHPFTHKDHDEPHEDCSECELREALRIVRGQTMKLARKPHLEALSQNRGEILVTLKQALTLLDTFVKEVEVATGKLGPTRGIVANIQKRYDIEVAQ